MMDILDQIVFHQKMAAWWLSFARWHEARSNFDCAEDCHAEVAWHLARQAAWQGRLAALSAAAA